MNSVFLVSRVLYRKAVMIIHLGQTLLCGSSGYPGNEEWDTPRPNAYPLFALHQVGFTMRALSPTPR